MVSLTHIRRCLSARSPELADVSDRSHAAVAAIIREAGSATELLFIERASHNDDPWSGHIAFPGGKVDPEDRGPRDAAERESLEELGLDLSSSEYLGQLDDVTGDALPVCVSGFVYAASDPVAFVLNNEVQQAFWTPLQVLMEPDRRQDREYHYRGVSQTHPTIDLLDNPPYLWGITYRFVKQFLNLLSSASGYP